MNRVKQLRVARGWRREDLAAHSGLSLSTVYLLERPRAKRPTTPTRRAIASAFGIDEAEIWPNEARG